MPLWLVLGLAACAMRAVPPQRPAYQGLDGPKPIVIYTTTTPHIGVIVGGRPSLPDGPYYGGYAVVDEDYVLTLHQNKYFPEFDVKVRETPQGVRKLLE